MKRPGWLGGKSGDGGEDPGDDERAPEGGRDSKDDPGTGGSAAERSARRIAAREERDAKGSGDVRRRLADRVGKAGGEEEPKATGAKPGGDGPAKRDEDTGAGAKPGLPAAKEKSSKAEEADTADAAEKKLNRPRRQSASGRGASRPRREQRGERDEKKRERGAKRDEAARRTRDERSKGAGPEDEDEVKGGRDKDKRGDGSRKGGVSKDGGERRRKRGVVAADRKRSRGDGPSAAKRARAGAASFAGALKRGAVETRKWAGTNAPKAGRMLLAALGAVFALFFEVLGFVLNLAIAAWRIVARPVRLVLGALDRAARAASRRLTPARALTVVVAGAAILLALSQYADYRSISIGNGAYADVQSLAPAPETGRAQTGDPHSYVFVPVAIACLLLLAVATIGGRWRACRLIALAGFAAIAVALLVDRPAGLDPGDAALAFEGVKAQLIGGFYAQIAAGVLLIGSSSMLARELRLAGAAERVPESRSTEREPKPRLRRRAAGTEGTARA